MCDPEFHNNKANLPTLNIRRCQSVIIFEDKMLSLDIIRRIAHSAFQKRKWCGELSAIRLQLYRPESQSLIVRHTIFASVKRCGG